MHILFRRNQYFVKEHIGLFRASNNFDIYDPASGEIILTCREPKLGFFTKLFRFSDYKRYTPFEILIAQPDGPPLITVRRGFTLLRSVVQVFDERNQLQGKFRQRLFSWGGRFDIMNEHDEVVCTLKGNWTSWDFTFYRGEDKIANVTKKWAGIGKEFFTSADNYAISIEPFIAEEDDVRLLIIAAVMCIDMVFKE